MSPFIPCPAAERVWYADRDRYDDNNVKVRGRGRGRRRPAKKERHSERLKSSSFTGTALYSGDYLASHHS